MEPRIKYKKHHDQLKGMFAIEQTVRASSLEHSLLHLVKMRASMINGCAYCIDMHSKDARALGETEQRLYGLAPGTKRRIYTDRERAALEWTDTPDADPDETRAGRAVRARRASTSPKTSSSP